MDTKRKKYILAAVAVVVVIVIGFFMHMQSGYKAYEEKCEAGAKMLSETKDFLAEIEALPGNPDSTEVIEYLKRLRTAQENLQTFQNDLQSAQPGSKYESAHKNLIEAVRAEKGILGDAEMILQKPVEQKAAGQLDVIKKEVTDLTEQAGAISIGKADFPVAMELNTLPDSLSKYVSQTEQEKDKKEKAEKEKQRLALLESNLRASYEKGANDGVIRFLIKSVEVVNDKQLNVVGELKNDWHNTHNYQNIAFIVELRRANAVIYRSRPIPFKNMPVSMRPNQRVGGTLVVTSDSSLPQDFDDVSLEYGPGFSYQF